MLSVDTLIHIIDGQCNHKNLLKYVQSISIDSRIIKKGQVFFAINGENFDGHNFVKEAVQRGAIAVVTEKSFDLDVPVICVEDTIKALGLIAHWHRKQFNIPVIAITGSSGKTTTKAFLYKVFSSQYQCLCSKESFNNHIGVPLTLLRMSSQDDIAIIEIGSNQIGDIAYLAKMVSPTIGILTNVAEAHLEGLGTKEGVYKEKISLIEYVDKNGIIIFNKDDDQLKQLSHQKISQKVVSYGLEKGVDYYAEDINIGSKYGMEFSCRNGKYTISGKVKHNIYNALATISCGACLKLGYECIISSIKDVPVMPGRCQIVNTKGVKLINDSYNANMLSYQSVIASLRNFEVKGKCIVVAGDILELGQYAQDCHIKLGNMLMCSDVDYVLFFGDLTYYSWKFMQSECSKKVHHFKDIESLNNKILNLIDDGDLILVKGSRAMRMERVVNRIINR